MRVVPALDEVKHRHAGRGLRGEAVAREELTLQGGEEALAHGIVVSVAHRPIEGRTPACWQRLPKAIDVYWQPWSE